MHSGLGPGCGLSCSTVCQFSQVARISIPTSHVGGSASDILLTSGIVREPAFMTGTLVDLDALSDLSSMGFRDTGNGKDDLGGREAMRQENVKFGDCVCACGRKGGRKTRVCIPDGDEP